MLYAVDLHRMATVDAKQHRLYHMCGSPAVCKAAVNSWSLMLRISVATPRSAAAVQAPCQCFENQAYSRHTALQLEVRQCAPAGAFDIAIQPRFLECFRALLSGAWGSMRQVGELRAAEAQLARAALPSYSAFGGIVSGCLLCATAG